MKVSKSGDLVGYFNNFFREVESSQREMEYKTAWKLVTEFGEFVDMRARSSPNKLHHVYEWNMVGNRNARLFEMNITPTSNGCIISYEFLKSIVPNDNGYIFEDKAWVMESGKQVSFETEKPVPLYDGEMFRVGPFTFIPGGPDVGGSFAETYRTYFMNRQNVLTMRHGQKISISSLTSTGGTKDGRSFYDRVIY